MNSLASQCPWCSPLCQHPPDEKSPARVCWWYPRWSLTPLQLAHYDPEPATVSTKWFSYSVNHSSNHKLSVSLSHTHIHTHTHTLTLTHTDTHTHTNTHTNTFYATLRDDENCCSPDWAVVSLVYCCMFCALSPSWFMLALLCFIFFYFLLLFSECCELVVRSPWYNRTGWLGVKHQLTYLPACVNSKFGRTLRLGLSVVHCICVPVGLPLIWTCHTC